MRIAAIVAFCLLSATLTFGECVEVTQESLKASSHVRIAVSVNGHPASHAKVNFCTNGGNSCLDAVTGDDGVAASPPLAFREYYSVVATLDGGATGGLFLRVVDTDKVPTDLSIDLTKSVRVVQDLLVTADNLPIRERVQAFRGTLQDVSGAIVPGAYIKIFRRGSEDKTAVQIIKSDSRGQFSAELSQGAYVAFFSFPGFRTEIVPFEITEQGKMQMLVKLDVARC